MGDEKPFKTNKGNERFQDPLHNRRKKYETRQSREAEEANCEQIYVAINSLSVQKQKHRSVRLKCIYSIYVSKSPRYAPCLLTGKAQCGTILKLS